MSTACAAFWCRRCFGFACGEAKVSSRKVTPTPSVPPTSRKRRRGPGPSLHHLGEQGEPNRDHLAVLGKIGYRLIQEGMLVLGDVARALGQVPVGGAERCQHLAGVAWIEEIDQGTVLTLE